MMRRTTKGTKCTKFETDFFVTFVVRLATANYQLLTADYLTS
jgi:hypothetical protein